MSEQYVAAIDQGTASSRCMVFDRSARIVSIAQKEHEQIFPRPGWVEHDPEEIWRNVVEVVQGALDNAQLHAVRPRGAGHRQPARVDDRVGARDAARRCTTRSTGRTRAPTTLMRELGGDAGQDRFRERCGLPLATYFSGPKLRWLLDTVPGLRERAEAGEVLFGTMDSWLIWKLTGRHLTDVTNASRTMLMGLETLDWDDVLLDAMGVPRAMLPEIRPSSEVYGEARGTAGRRARRLGARRPAGRAVRADVLLARRGQVHLRDRQLPALQHRRAAGAVGQRPADDGLLPHRRRGADLRAGGLDRGHRRARAVVPRQHHADRLGARDRDAGAHGRGQRRLLLRPRLLRACSRRTGAATPAASSPG